MRTEHRVLVGIAAVLLLAATAHAQTATGQIVGTVKDATGGVMPKAKVVVTNQETGFTRETATRDDGTYVVPLLPVGVYLVTAEQTGFKLAVVSEIQLNVDQVQRVDLELAPGDISERIEVKADATTIETETSTVGQVISQKQVTELPLNGRNFVQLLFLGAGAVQTTGEQGQMRQGAGNAISIMGARPTSNNFMLDGTSNVDTALGTPVAILSVDAIQEFKEQTSTYSAEYGFGSNQINIVSKSGSNDFHGAAFTFIRNEALDAHNFFDNKAAPKPTLDQKQPGFVLGGPVFRNKTFFLANYEGLRVERGFSSFYRVPTPDELAGRFTTAIIDPTTGQPFPNNTIPQSRFSRLARLAIAKYVPAPNSTAAQGNYQGVRTLPQEQDQYTIRIDQNLGKYGSVFGRITRVDYSSTSTGSVNDLGDSQFTQEATNWQFTHTWVIHSSLVNSFRFGRVTARADQGAAIPADPADVTALGLTGVFTNLSDAQRVYPRINMTNYSQIGGGTNVYTTSYQPMWDVGNTTTWVKGSHTLNAGFNFRKWSLNRDLANEFLGSFTFAGYFTGNPVADMLLGYYSGSGVFQPAAFSLPDSAGNPRQFDFTYFAPYVQDDWRLSSKMTLNMGLRWDYRATPYEVNNRMGWLDVSNPRGGLCIADENLVTQGVTGDGSYYRYCGRRNPTDPAMTNFGPRLGFAWRPFDDDRTVIRGGYGIFYDAAEGREIDGSADIYPYVSRGAYNQSLGQLTPLLTTDALFPPIPTQGPVNPAANGFIAVIISEDPKDPYVHQWSFGVQRALTGATRLELNYVGSKGTHLLMRRNINQAYPYTPSNPTVAGRKPYANFGPFYINSDWSGYSNYNAMNAKLEHRTANALASVAYTWGKSTDSKSAAAGIGGSAFNGWQGLLNNHDPARDHALSDFDVDHRVVASFVYNLPFGRGQRFGTDAGAFGNAVIGGWQLNGIFTWQRGFPITITGVDLGGANDSFGSNRADLVGDPYPSGFESSVEKWFDTTAFAQPALGQFGSVGRNTLRAPNFTNLDLALFKNFDLPMKTKLQFRFESFNALNHAQFNAPNTNVTSPQFGVIGSARPARINQVGLKFIF
jgi:hypothetical protein